MFIVPESPKWLLIKKGSKSKEAIKVLNYIAWLNGSTYRVPPNTEIDVIEKIPKQKANLSHSRSNLAILRYSLDMGSGRTLKTNRSEEKISEKIKKTFKLTRILFTDKRYYPMHLRLFLVFVATSNVYFLALFN